MIKRILVAPDKFKGSLTALEVCTIVKEGLCNVNSNFDVLLHPLADGGDGSIDVLKHFIDFESHSLAVTGPNHKKRLATYYTSNNEAYVELANASGIVLLGQDEKNPRYTTTQGTGELINDAIFKGYKKINLFLGGSCTNDAGIGIAHALGFRFLDKTNEALKPIGDNLIKIDIIDCSNVSPLIKNVEFTILCDVTNPLYGTNGAAYAYGKQKGASPEDIVYLDNGLKNFATVVERQYNIDIHQTPGGGSAGGIGAGIMALLNGNIISGIDKIMSLTQFDTTLKNIDLIITGEGRLDNSSLQGKVIGKLTILAKEKGIPLIVVAGQNLLYEEEIKTNGISKVYTISEIAYNGEEAMMNGAKYLNTITGFIIDFINQNNQKYITTNTWNKVATLYQEKFMNLELYNKTYDFLCQSIKDNVAKVLDVGCGPGNITKYLLSKRPNFTISGIDIAPNMVSLARKNNPTANFEVLDIRSINQLKSKYNAIVGGFCIPYLSVQDANLFINDCSCLLENDGLLYISFVDDNQKKSGFQTGSSRDAIYFQYHSLVEIKKQLTSSNFEEIKSYRLPYQKSIEEIEYNTIIIARKK
jgi:glycerate kinase